MTLSTLRRWLTNEIPRPPEATAVVFAHGYLGALPRAYWIGCTRLMAQLRARGIAVHVAQAHMTGRIAERARHLARELDATTARRVIVVGHSMGGLDARFLAAWLDPQHRVSDVITLGTPHHGTYAADMAHRLAPRLPALVRLLDQGGLYDLTRAAVARFNAEVPDRPDVRYHAIAGRIAPAAVPAPIRPLARRLQQHDGDNDGLVPVASAHWGPTVVIDDADHFALIGLEWLAGPDVEARVSRLFRSDPRPVGVLRSLLRDCLLRPPG